MTLRIIAALAAALVIGSNAYAAIDEEAPPKTGNDFLYACSSAQPPTKLADALILMHCLGHGVGFAEGLAFWEEVHPDFASICIPKEVDAEQLRQVTLRCIRLHPENRPLQNRTPNDHGIPEAWPCKNPLRN
jgi:hypothetical protein